ncbi:hypothetical protein DL96DRAFT_1595492 [Flagelloscypha sp. PMI_526]|nr:hypothetical protein DL96DRAFT_1595492 [Flagelloscypha sp. PMI_526]
MTRIDRLLKHDSQHIQVQSYSLLRQIHQQVIGLEEAVRSQIVVPEEPNDQANAVAIPTKPVPSNLLELLKTIYDDLCRLYPDATPIAVVILLASLVSKADFFASALVLNWVLRWALPSPEMLFQKDGVTVIDLRGNGVELPLDLCENWDTFHTAMLSLYAGSKRNSDLPFIKVTQYAIQDASTLEVIEVGEWKTYFRAGATVELALGLVMREPRCPNCDTGLSTYLAATCAICDRKMAVRKYVDRSAATLALQQKPELYHRVLIHWNAVAAPNPERSIFYRSSSMDGPYAVPDGAQAPKLSIPLLREDLPTIRQRSPHFGLW